MLGKRRQTGFYYWIFFWRSNSEGSRKKGLQPPNSILKQRIRRKLNTKQQSSVFSYAYATVTISLTPNVKKRRKIVLVWFLINCSKLFSQYLRYWWYPSKFKALHIITQNRFVPITLGSVICSTNASWPNLVTIATLGGWHEMSVVLCRWRRNEVGIKVI